MNMVLRRPLNKLEIIFIILAYKQKIMQLKVVKTFIRALKMEHLKRRHQTTLQKQELTLVVSANPSLEKLSNTWVIQHNLQIRLSKDKVMKFISNSSRLHQIIIGTTKLSKVFLLAIRTTGKVHIRVNHKMICSNSIQISNEFDK